MGRVSVKGQNMLKKLNLLLAVLCCLIFAGCCSDKSYNVVLVGDVHFDHMKYHDMSKIKHLGIPGAKYIYNKDGYFSWRNHSIWTTVNKGGSVEKKYSAQYEYVGKIYAGAAGYRRCRSA